MLNVAGGILLGLAIGCIYALIALGFSNVHRTTGVVNLAQGGFVMAGGMTGAWLYSLGVPFILTLIGALIVCALLGLLLGGAVVVPLWRRRAPGFVVILATLVVLLMLENAYLHIFGSRPRSLPAWTEGRLSIGVAVPLQYLWVIGGTVLLVVGFRVFLGRTLLGKAMQACAIDRDVSSLLGIPPEAIGVLSFVIAAVLGGIAGLLIAPLQYTAFNIGINFGIKGFVAAILGGLGSIEGALVGGIALGLIEVSTALYISTRYEDAIVFAVLLLVIALRPRGLMGVNWE